MGEGNRRTPLKGFFKTYLSGIIRAAVVALLVIAQFLLVFFLAFGIYSYGIFIYVIIEIVSIVAVIGLVNKRTSNSFKIGWMVIISLLPIAGLIMYLLWGRTRRTRDIRRRHMSYIRHINEFNIPDGAAFSRFGQKYPDYNKMARLGENYGFPLYDGNGTHYFESGETAFESLIEDVEAAEKFVFMSFFIVASGALWEKIRPILVEKAKAGVEIRFLSDDFGSMFRTDDQFWKDLEASGVKTARFNRITRYLDKLYLNYRNHQKIVVIDGNIGYTGGFNLADEYVNAIDRFGHWKDGGVRIEGPAVWGLTTVFLGMWDMTVHDMENDVDRYRPDAPARVENEKDAFCQIISDGPENNPDNPIIDMITQLFGQSQEYLYISTPYLVLEDSLGDELIRAAKSGVDVRIVTPGIPDKKMVNQLTKYNYGRLLEGGVRIYEYTPGFIHIKNMVTKHCSLIGTINLDYRSLFLHYECGAVIWDEELNTAARKDLERVFEISREITLEMWKNRPLGEKMGQWLLNIFASEV